MSRKRLCYAAHRRTVAAWTKVRKAIRRQDPDLAEFMVPECVYRPGVCPEFHECHVGKPQVMRAYGIGG
jgi:hypothetical protein